MLKLMLTRKIYVVGTAVVMSVACSNIVQYVRKEENSLLLCCYAVMMSRRCYLTVGKATVTLTVGHSAFVAIYIGFMTERLQAFVMLC